MMYGLTDENQMIADTVRSFVEKEIYPLEALVAVSYTHLTLPTTPYV